MVEEEFCFFSFLVDLKNEPISARLDPVSQRGGPPHQHRPIKTYPALWNNRADRDGGQRHSDNRELSLWARLPRAAGCLIRRGIDFLTDSVVE